jgi:UDP-2,3-diacylglucosamine pyrophosphatase LpxH
VERGRKSFCGAIQISIIKTTGVIIMEHSPDNPRRVRSVFLSDFHIGYRGFDACAVTNFLKSHDFKILYLVGDIFDGWKLEKRWYWNKDYTDLIDTLVQKRNQGVKILYTPGNHDEKMRDILFLPVRFLFAKKFGIKIDDSFEHVCANGKRFLVLHGDQFDSRVVRGISQPADTIYEFLTGPARDFFVDRKILPPAVEYTNEKGRRKRFSMGKMIAKNGSGYLKGRVHKVAVKRVQDDYDGLIFGHTHYATLEDIEGTTIANCGSWTLKEDRAAHHTGIVEKEDGELELVEWPMMRRPKGHDARKNTDVADIRSHFRETRIVANLTHQLWREKRPKLKLSA